MLLTFTYGTLVYILIQDLVQPNPLLNWGRKVAYILAILVGFITIGAAIAIITAGELSVLTCDTVYSYRKMFLEGKV